MESVHSKLKKLENEVGALRESEEFASALLDKSPIPILVINPDTSIRYANRALEELTGLATNEIVGKQAPYPWWTEETLEMTGRDLKNAMRNGAFRLEELFRRKDGSRFWVEITSAPVKRDKRMRYYLANWVDITERKLAEKALRESEERYALATAAAQVGVWDWNLQTGAFYLDPRIKGFLGYSDDEIPNDLDVWVKYVHPDDSQAVMDAAQAHLDGKTPEYAYEHRMLHKDGSVRWISVNGRAIRDAEGKVVRMVGTDADITERKRVEEALRREKEFAESIVQTAPVIILLLDREGRIVSFNPCMERISGYTLEEVQGKEWFETFLPKRDRERIQELFSTAVGGVSTRGNVNSIVTKDGQKREIEWYDNILNDADGNMVALLSIGQDITERRLAEEELHRAKELFEKTFESQPDAIFMLGSGRSPLILDCNRAAMEVFGYTGEEMKGRDSAFLHTDESSLREFQGHLYPAIEKEGFMHSLEFRMRRKDGTVFPTEHSVVPLEEGGKHVGWISVVRDITGRKRAEEKLRSLASELSLTEERERRRIATELHDEIGQTLAMIKIKLGELRKEEATKEVAGPLDNVLNLLGKAIQNTRSLTFDLSPPVLYELGFEAAVAWLAERYTGEHGILVGFEDDGEPKPLDEDLRILLFQSVRELLNNAVRYAQAGEVRIRVGRDGEDIRVEVEDDGVGFDPSGLKQKEGFGLFNIHERLSSVGGRFILSSAPQEGTRVILKVSLKDKDVQS